MRSLYKSNVLRGVFVAVDYEDVRVIDSNELLQEKMEAWGQTTRDIEPYDDGGGEMEFTALNPEEVDGGFSFDEDSSVIRGDLPEGEEEEPAGPTAEDLEEQGRAFLREAEEKLAEAKIECERMVIGAKAEIEEARLAAIEEGRKLGHEEGHAHAAAEIEQMKADIDAEKEKLEREYGQLVDELEPRFISLVTDIYERVFAVDLKDYAPIVAHLLSTTIRNSDETRDFIIRVAPDDYDYVVARRDEIKESAAVGQGSFEIIKDQTLAAGACLIETAGGIFDAGFDTQLENLNNKLRLLSYGGEGK
jgi:flagellar assembly protein FliH